MRARYTLSIRVAISSRRTCRGDAGPAGLGLCRFGAPSVRDREEGERALTTGMQTMHDAWRPVSSTRCAPGSCALANASTRSPLCAAADLAADAIATKRRCLRWPRPLLTSGHRPDVVEWVDGDASAKAAKKTPREPSSDIRSTRLRPRPSDSVLGTTPLKSSKPSTHSPDALVRSVMREVDALHRQARRTSTLCLPSLLFKGVWSLPSAQELSLDFP